MEDIESRSRGKYKFTWINLADVQNFGSSRDPTTGTKEMEVDNDEIQYHLDPNEFCQYLVQNFHHVFVKSNWNWIVDNVIRATNCKNKFPNHKISNSLLISGSSAPPSLEAIQYYDTLFYETYWYAEKYELNRLHPRAFHAFGIDLDFIKSLKLYQGGLEVDTRDHSNVYKDKRLYYIAEEESPSHHFNYEENNRIINRNRNNNIKSTHQIDLTNYDEFEWDYVMFRSLTYYCADKRTELLAERPGKKLIFGRSWAAKPKSSTLPPGQGQMTEHGINAYPKSNSSETKVEKIAPEQEEKDTENVYANNIEQAVVEYLESYNVTVLPMLPYEELMERLQKLKIQSKIKNIYVPDRYPDGGERSVLEGRALGINVVVEDDNPKLQELLTSPIYDHRYYADQLILGLESIGL